MGGWSPDGHFQCRQNFKWRVAGKKSYPFIPRKNEIKSSAFSRPCLAIYGMKEYFGAFRNTIATCNHVTTRSNDIFKMSRARARVT